MGLYDQGVVCPYGDDCQEAFVVDPESCVVLCEDHPGGRRCESSQVAAESYVEHVIGHSWRDEAHGGDKPLLHCPNCRVETLVDRSDEHPRFVCFNCEEFFHNGWEKCDSCRVEIFETGDRISCSDCEENRVNPND